MGEGGGGRGPGWETSTLQYPFEDAGHKGCTVEVAQVLGHGDEAVHKQVRVTQHVLILSLHKASRHT